MKYFCVLFLFFSTFQSMAAADSIQTETTEPPLSLIIAAIYSSNADYFGQTAAERLSYVLTNASLRFSNGIYLSASAYKLFNYGSGISAADLGIGYELDITKKLASSFGYSRSFYPANSPFVQAANDNTLSGSLAYDWNWFNTTLSADYAFGESEDVFAGFSTSKLISLGSLVKDKDLISIEPAVQIVAGTQQFYKTYTTREDIKDKLLEKFKDKGLPPGLDNGTTTTTVPYSRFDLLSYSLNLPLAYSRVHYTFEAAYKISILSDKVETISDKPRSFFNLSFYYLF